MSGCLLIFCYSACGREKISNLKSFWNTVINIKNHIVHQASFSQFSNWSWSVRAKRAFWQHNCKKKLYKNNFSKVKGENIKMKVNIKVINRIIKSFFIIHKLISPDTGTLTSRKKINDNDFLWQHAKTKWGQKMTEFWWMCCDYLIITKKEFSEHFTKAQKTWDFTFY